MLREVVGDASATAAPAWNSYPMSHNSARDAAHATPKYSGKPRTEPETGNRGSATGTASNRKRASNWPNRKPLQTGTDANREPMQTAATTPDSLATLRGASPFVLLEASTLGAVCPPRGF